MNLADLSAYGRSSTRTAWVTNPARRVVWWLIAPYFRAAGTEIDRHIAAEIDRHIAAKAGNPVQFDEQDAANAVRLIAASQLGGIRKDLTAIAYRLAGLEEESAGIEVVRHDIAELQQDVRAVVQGVSGRIDLLERGTRLRAGDRLAIGDENLVIIVSSAGTRLLVHENDLIGHLIAEGGEWEPHVRTAIERAAQPDGIAVDAGAYIGTHTITMSRCFRTVHAFEPQLGIYQMLCANLALNSRLNVVTHNAGLYDRAGSMRLAPQERQDVEVFIHENAPNYSQISNAAALTFDFVPEGGGDVKAIALDDMALKDVAVIKIDTQGADLRVLRGAQGTIRRCQPTVLFEWERDLGKHHGAALEDYHTFFDALGYDITMLQDTTPGRQADYIATPRR